MIDGSRSLPRRSHRSDYRDLPERVRGEYNFNSRWLPLDRSMLDRVPEPFRPGPRTPMPLRLHFIDEGPDDAEHAVLCLHGNPTWSYYYRRLIAALRDEDRVRVIAPDHIGMGLSDKPAAYPYRLANHIANVEALVEALGLTRITLVMHDWGGAIGMGFAVRHPHLIERLVVLNTAAFPVKRIPWRIAVCRLPLFGALAVRGLNAFARAALWMATARPAALQQSGAALGLVWPYRRLRDRIAIHRFVQDIPMGARHPSWPTLTEVEAGLARLTEKPMLIGRGMQDWCFAASPFLEEWQRRFPQATVLRYPQAGHYVLEDAADELVPAIVRFLGRGPNDDEDV